MFSTFTTTVEDKKTESTLNKSFKNSLVQKLSYNNNVADLLENSEPSTWLLPSKRSAMLLSCDNLPKYTQTR